PSVPVELDTDVSLSDARHRGSLGWGWSLSEPGQRFAYSPMSQPTVGHVRTDTRWISIDPSSTVGSYEFDASSLFAGIPKDLSVTLPPVSHSFSVDNSYFSDGGFELGGAARLVFLPRSYFAFATFQPIQLPVSRTDYVYA